MTEFILMEVIKSPAGMIAIGMGATQVIKVLLGEGKKKMPDFIWRIVPLITISVLMAVLHPYFGGSGEEIIAGVVNTAALWLASMGAFDFVTDPKANRDMKKEKHSEIVGELSKEKDEMEREHVVEMETLADDVLTNHPLD